MSKEKVIRTYEQTQSLAKTAELNGISWDKVRKILISEGLYSTPTAETIRRHFEQGRSIDQIAEILGISRNTVHSYLPYQKGEYKSDNPTENAIKIRNFREKKGETLKWTDSSST